MLVEIQCLPTPSGTSDQPYAHVDAAIAAVRAAGVRHEVGALGTTFEAEPHVAWPLLRAVHEACLAAGADSVMTVIKVFAVSSGDTPTIDGLTADHRGRDGA